MAEIKTTYVLEAQSKSFPDLWRWVSQDDSLEEMRAKKAEYEAWNRDRTSNWLAFRIVLVTSGREIIET